MGNRIILSCEEIYSRVIKLNNSMGYYYYTVPFKEKVFFLPLRDFQEHFNKGNISEITFTVDHVKKGKWIMLDYRVYNKKQSLLITKRTHWDPLLRELKQKGEL